MLDVRLPDLTFPSVGFGLQETPWDLIPCVYRGGANAPVKKVASMIEAGKLGRPLIERIELVRQIRECLLNTCASGGSRNTVRTNILVLRIFFRWADEMPGQEFCLTTVEQSYRHWCDALLHRVRVVRDLKERTAHQYGVVVGGVLDKVLERDKPLVKTTRLRKPKTSPRAVSPQADKQNLEETFAFGHLLLDLADALSVDAIWGSLPLQIPLRSGNTLEELSLLKRSDTLKPFNPKWPSQSRQAAGRAILKRSNWEAEKSYRTRYPLINLRIMAEMFMLMGQPAVNLAQAHQLRMDQWNYKSSSAGYEVRSYKHRRGGPVSFVIYSEYRAVFERYLAWRKAIFPDDPDGLLFPFLGKEGKPPTRRGDQTPNFKNFERYVNAQGWFFLALWH